MNKKITIKRVSRKEVNTKFGHKWKVSYQDNEGVWYGAWAGDWNKDWKEGQVINVTVTSREYNGKTYYDIQAPLETAINKYSGSNIDLSRVNQELAEMKAMIEEIYKAVLNKHVPDVQLEEPPSYVTEEIPF